MNVPSSPDSGDALACLADMVDVLLYVLGLPAGGVVHLEDVDRARQEVDPGAVAEQVVGVLVHDLQRGGACQPHVAGVHAQDFDGELAGLVAGHPQHGSGDPLVGKEQVHSAYRSGRFGLELEDGRREVELWHDWCYHPFSCKEAFFFEKKRKREKRKRKRKKKKKKEKEKKREKERERKNVRKREKEKKSEKEVERNTHLEVVAVR